MSTHGSLSSVEHGVGTLIGITDVLAMSAPEFRVVVLYEGTVDPIGVEMVAREWVPCGVTVQAVMVHGGQLAALRKRMATWVEGREVPKREGCCQDGNLFIRGYEGRRVLVIGPLGPEKVPAMLNIDHPLPVPRSMTTVYFCPWCGARLAAAGVGR